MAVNRVQVGERPPIRGSERHYDIMIDPSYLGYSAIIKGYSFIVGDGFYLLKHSLLGYTLDVI